MGDRRKTRAQLLDELAELRQRIARWEAFPSFDAPVESVNQVQLPEEALRVDALVDIDQLAHILTLIAARPTPEIENFHRQVQQAGYDPAEYLKTLGKQMVAPQSWLLPLLMLFNGTSSMLAGMLQDNQRSELYASQLAFESEAHQRVRTALHESETKYRAMFDASTDAIFLETLEGKLLDCNPTACRMFGYSKDEFLSLSVADLVPPEVAADLPSIIDRVAAAGGVLIKSANKRKDGQVFPVEVSTQMTTLEGQPRVIAFIRDISERERDAEALARQMKELTAIYETSLEINAQREVSRLLSAIVERAVHLIGAPMGGLYLMRQDGQSLELVVSYNLPQDYTGAVLRLGEGLSGRVAQTGEVIALDDYQTWEGRAEIYQVNNFRRVLGVPLKIEDRVIGVINVTDVQKREPYRQEQIRLLGLLANQAAIAIHNAQLYAASQAELKEREQVEARLVQTNASLDRQLRFTEALLSAIPTPVFFKDARGRYLGCNKAFTEQMGVASQDLKGKTVYELWPGELAQVYHRQDMLLMEQPVHQEYEFQVKDKTGKYRDVIFAKDVFRDETGSVAGLVGAYVDITDRKRAERGRDALYRLSEASQTAEDLDELYKHIHHIIGELMPASNFYIALYDEPANTLSFPYFTDDVDDRPMTQPLGRGLTEYVLRSGRPLLATPEVYDQLVAEGEVESVGAPSVDWLGAPLKAKKNTIGVMAVQTYSQAIRYTQGDQALLGFISTQAAMAIQRKRAEAALRQSEERYRLLFENAPVGIVLSNPQGVILEVNPVALQILGSPSAEATKAINILIFPPLVRVGYAQDMRRCVAMGVSVVAETLYTSKWGKSVEVHYYLMPIFDETGQVILVQTILEDITARKQAENEVRRLNLDLQRHAHEMVILNRAGQVMTATLDLEQLLQLLVEETRNMMDVEAVMVLLRADASGNLEDRVETEHAPELYFAAGSGLGAEQMVAGRTTTQAGIAGRVMREKAPFRSAGPEQIDLVSNECMNDAACQVHAVLAVPLLSRGKVLGVVEAINKSAGGFFDAHDQEVLEALCSAAGIALENAQLLLETQRRAEQLSLLYDAGLALNRTLNLNEQLEMLSKIAMQALRADHSGFFRYDAVLKNIRYEFGVGRGADLEARRHFEAQAEKSSGLVSELLQKHSPVYLPDVTKDARWMVGNPEMRSVLWMPVGRADRLSGFLTVASLRPNAFKAEDRQLLALLANQFAVSMENARLYDAAIDAADRSTTLHWLSQEIISASLDRERVYHAIYAATSKLMPAEAFIIALLEDGSNVIEMTYCIDRGERYPNQWIEGLQGLSGKVIAAGQAMLIDDTEQDPRALEMVHFGEAACVRSILAVPMHVGEKTLGMLSSQSYQPHAFNEEDAYLLEILAAYAAIALENGRLFTQMQASNTELAKAYEATIEGWSKALEMRDKETKGHSDRVTRFTERVARALGLSEDTLLHLRRGVLLHDIGKMAVPDHILLKPGPLTDDEWLVIRQHPSYAYHMLSGIPFLKPAIDIPYCHHENWDGSGYPRGLKGEEIPLGARIFAMVDVWDALTTDRPYHPAWVEEMARAYILAQSGARFDPKLVEIFIRLLDAGELKG